MVLSRKLDDKEIQLKNQSQIFFQISGAGHEAVLVAAGMHLRAGYDWFYPYYRDRALCLALGMTPLEMLLSAWAPRTTRTPAAGRCRRTGATSAQHRLAGQPHRHAVPAGRRLRRGRACSTSASPTSPTASRVPPDEVVYVSIGDGATSEGEFWESLNTACTRNAAGLFLIEDNGYAISVPVEVQTAGGDISKLVESFPGLKVVRCDGTDFLESYRALGEAVAYARRERAPRFVHAKVIRPTRTRCRTTSGCTRRRRSARPRRRATRSRRMRAFLKAEGLATEADLEAIAADVEREVNEAADAALAAPKPAVETAGWYVYSPDVDPDLGRVRDRAAPEGKPDTMVAAINRTLKDEMARNPRIVVFGEDVADASREEALAKVSGKGGVFKVTHGLQRAYGATRVFNSPLAEANIIGRAVGMATRGIKPVVEIQFFDYIWPAMMQLRDEMSMLRYRSNNNFSCPMVVRVPIGGYLRGGAPYHSQSGESIFAHCPGIRIVFPSNAVDAAGLLRTAIRCDDPVMFLEHKHLYRQTYNKGAVPRRPTT
jgi:2-oxoisovalerate dehydrogenase E1 component